MKRRRRMVKCTEDGCSGRFNVVYEDCAPIFICDTCSKKDLTWKKFYEDYLQLFVKRENWNIKKHQTSCIMGFFCHMYYEFYKVEYLFWPSNRNPFSSKECVDANKILASFNGNAHEVRKYIYWVFKKGINKNTTITDFGYINAPGLIRKYNLYVKKKNTFRRESKLPKDFIEWCKTNKPGVFDEYNLETMNDLGAMLNFYNTYSTERNMKIESDVILKAKQIGLINKYGNLNIGDTHERNNR
jgi:hypothetical protein